MEEITTKQLNEILTRHAEWANSCGAKGVRANLSGANLSGANLRGADLSGADLRGANLNDADLTYTDLKSANLSGAILWYADLSSANLWYADLSSADFKGADFKGAYFKGANLSGANLRGANLWNADLRYADLRYADLSGADLGFADLKGADLRDANLRGANLSGAKINFHIACPEKGSFIAFKKAGCYIIELFIPSNAKRCSATSRKCRCSKAKIISITTLSGDKTNITEVHSDYDPNFIYKLGEYVEVKNFNDNRWNECSTGIHFFLTRQEAVEY